MSRMLEFYGLLILELYMFIMATLSGFIFYYRFAWIGALILAVVQLIWIAAEYVLFYNTLGIQIFMIIIPLTAMLTIMLLFRSNIRNTYFT